jgi:hypothetical protein
VAEWQDDTDWLIVTLDVEEGQLDTVLVIAWLCESKLEILVVTEGDDENEFVKEVVTVGVDVSQADTLSVPNALAVIFVVPVALMLGVDDTEIVRDGDLLYVDETVWEEDIEFVKEAVRQFVVDPERVVEWHEDTEAVEERLTDEEWQVLTLIVPVIEGVVEGQDEIDELIVSLEVDDEQLDTVPVAVTLVVAEPDGLIVPVFDSLCVWGPVGESETEGLIVGVIVEQAEAVDDSVVDRV